jgi:hypothetical protein
VRLFILLGVLIGLLTLGNGALYAAPLRQTVNKVYISSVNDVSFVVSWTTDTATNGSVDYGTTTSLGNTATDSESSTTTHYVTVTGLNPNTTYYFQVNSGSTTDDNGGSYYQVTTGPLLTIPSPAAIYGTVYESDGSTPLANAIVYLWVEDADGSGTSGSSQRIAVRTDGSGVWYYNLSSLRVPDASTSYTYNAGSDELYLVAQGGSAGCVGELNAPQPDGPLSVTIPASLPAQISDITMDGVPNAVQMADVKVQSLGKPMVWSLMGILAVGGVVLWKWKLSDIAL